MSGLEVRNRSTERKRLVQGFSHGCVKGKCMPQGRANIYYCRSASEYCVESTDLKFDNPAPSGRVSSF